jgi:hypothetical protein
MGKIYAVFYFVIFVFSMSACNSTSRTVVKGGIAIYEEIEIQEGDPNSEIIHYKEISNDSLVTTYRNGARQTRRADDPRDISHDESSYSISRDPNDESKVLLGRQLRVFVEALAGTVPVKFDSEEEGVFKSGNWNDFMSGEEIVIVLTEKGQGQLIENSIKAAEVVGAAMERALAESTPELAQLVSIETKGRRFQGSRTYSGTRHRLKVSQSSSEWLVKIRAKK